jgi:ABC-type branched-subunit amino acid transport system substrate-binding protein/outer membrane protein assembly factor BamD (BamD/ComL family)
MGDDLFRSAENSYIKGDFISALEAYQNYTRRYPGGSWIPESLLRIGQIHMAQGRTTQALEAFQQLSDVYPNSSMAMDGELAALRIYYQMKNYQGVIQRANDLVKKPIGKEKAFEIHEILGDAYWSSGKIPEAMAAWDRAFGTLDTGLQHRLMEKNKEMLGRLSATELVQYSRSVSNPVFQGELLYLAALQDVQEEKFDRAGTTLDLFEKRYADHPRTKDVRNLLDCIHRQSGFSGHTIGCLVPLTGPHEAFGKKALRGLELALHHYNQIHPEVPMTIQVRDTESSPEKAGVLVRELVDRGAAAILGPIGGSENAAQTAHEIGIPIITLTQKDGITAIGDYVFRNYITPRMQAEALVYFASVKLGASRFGCLYPSDNYGISFADVFRERVLFHGKRMAGEESYDADTVDFGEAVHNLKEMGFRAMIESGGSDGEASTRGENAGIQVLFIPDSASRAIQIIPQISFYDMGNIVLFGPNMWNTPAMLSLSTEPLTGVMFADCFHAESNRETVRFFVDYFREVYGELPGFLEAITYDSAMMLFTVLGGGEFRYRAEIRQALLQMPETDGVTGPYRFSPEREAWKQMVILQISQGRFVEVAGR